MAFMAISFAQAQHLRTDSLHLRFPGYEVSRQKNYERVCFGTPPKYPNLNRFNHFDSAVSMQIFRSAVKGISAR